MKITNITSMLAAAAAVGFCMSATAGEGQSGTLVLADPVTNVSVTASSVSGGSWNEPAPNPDGVYLEIDSDAESPNQFTATDAGITTSKVVKCEFVLKPSPVPHTGSLPAPDGDAQVAFCIATNTSSGGEAKLMAYVADGSDAWKELSGPEVPTGDTDYKLTITFDYSATAKYAKFAIDNSNCTYNAGYWIQTNTSNNKTNITDYCFVGSGSLKSILTTGQDIAAEEASITPPSGEGSVNIEIPEEALAAVAGATTDEKVSSLLANGSNSQPKLNNYILFGTENNVIKEDAMPVSKISTTVNGTDIPIGFDNIDTAAAAARVNGATVKYTLKGRKTYNGGFDTLVSATTEASAMKITSANIEDGYKFFKVDVTVEYTGK